MHSKKIMKRKIRFAMLLAALMATCLIPMAVFAEGSDAQLRPNSEDNPYELAYGESVTLIAGPDDERLSNRWDYFYERDDTWQYYRFNFHSCVLTSRNTDSEAKTVIL